ncbi:variable large family protein (plasmid) [Borrelia turicatae 91E135]|nr:variable large family protein [Borrelia turicatae 91E135]
MLGGVLGFNTKTKKSDVADYFKTVQDTVQGTKDKLNKIVADMKSENNPNASTTETAVTNLVTTTLDKIIQGAKTASEAIGSDASDLLANVAAGGNNAGKGVKGNDVDRLVNGIKSIVDVVLGDKGNPKAGDDKKAEDGSTARANNTGAGMLFANDKAGDAANASKKVATDAAKAVGAVTGADILKAMIKDNGNAAKLAANDTANGNIAAAANAKDGTIAGGIALRAMAKNGKFANANDNANPDVASAVKGSAVSAVTNALNELTIAIRNTIDTGLKTVKDAIKFNSIDTPVTTDNTTSETKKN